MNALTQDRGNLAENEMAILAAHGTEVYTLGNLDDCLYQRGTCPSQIATIVLKYGGVGAGAITGGGALLAIPDETSSQFIDEAYQRQYHLGQSGTWPGGHGAILNDTQSVPDIVWLLAHAPSATLYATVSTNAAPQLHVFVTGPERGVQAVTVQVASSNGNVVQQFALNGAGATAYTNDLTLDPKKVGVGVLTATIISVTDSQNLEHLPQAAGDGTETIRHDFIARTMFHSATGNPTVDITATPKLPTGTIKEFPLPTANSYPLSLVVGPDGNLWFTDIGVGQIGVGQIGRITPTGTISEYPVPNPNSWPRTIVAGSDGNLWFTESGTSAIGRISPSGIISEFPTPTPNSIPAGPVPVDLVAGPDGNLWFTENGANQIGRITPSGAITEFAIPTSNHGPSAIIVGPDGNLWFDFFSSYINTNQIGRITPSGTVSVFTLTAVTGSVDAIAAGPDGNLWFLDIDTNQIGRITPSGTITEFALPTANILGFNIIAGPDGNLWFLDGPQIGRITPTGTVSEFSLPIPNSDSIFGDYFTSIDLAVGPDGNLWFTEGITFSDLAPGVEVSDVIGRITPTGSVTDYVLPARAHDSNPANLTIGPDGNLWFTENSAIGRISP